MRRRRLLMFGASGMLAAAAAAGAIAAGGNNKGDSGSATLSCAVGGEASNVQKVSWSPTTLWPPNGKLQTITISAKDTEGESGETLTLTVESITSTDGFVGTADNGVGNTASAPEDGTLATTTVQIPAERAGTSLDGNSYDIGVSCADDDGTAHQHLTVTVPHDQAD